MGGFIATWESSLWGVLPHGSHLDAGSTWSTRVCLGTPRISYLSVTLGQFAEDTRWWAPVDVLEGRCHPAESSKELAAEEHLAAQEKCRGTVSKAVEGFCETGLHLQA